MSDTDPEHVRELLDKTQERHEERQEEIAEFHDAVKEESDAEVIETTCNIAGDMTVDVSAKRNGELMDKIGHIEERLEYVESEERGTYKVTEAAEDASQLLADLVDDPHLDKQEFYKVYRSEGLETLGELIESVMQAIETEVKTRRQAADGFRKKS